MSQPRQIAYAFTFFFFLIAAVLTWSYVYRDQHFIAPGERPTDAATEKKITLPPLRAADPVRGSADPQAVTIVVFADYHCPFCRLLYKDLLTVLKDSKRPVRMVWRDSVLVSERPVDILAPHATRCANEQGKFWEMHDALFLSDDLGLEALASTASKLSLNMEKWGSCMESGRYLMELKKDRQIADDHAMTAAPTFFIGNNSYVGYVPAKDILSAVQRAPSPRP